jgi:hypothetical protein
MRLADVIVRLWQRDHRCVADRRQLPRNELGDLIPADGRGATEGELDDDIERWSDK